MLGNESILRRNAAATGAHSGRIAVPDFAAVKRPNGLELVVLSVLQCIHSDGGHAKAHNFLRVVLGPIYAGKESTIQLTQGSRDNFYGGFVAAPVRCTASCCVDTPAAVLRRAAHGGGLDAHFGGDGGADGALAWSRRRTRSMPIRSYDVTLGDKMVTDTMVALVYKAILEAIKNSGKEGPRAAQPGLAGFYSGAEQGGGPRVQGRDHGARGAERGGAHPERGRWAADGAAGEGAVGAHREHVRVRAWHGRRRGGADWRCATACSRRWGTRRWA